MHVDLFSRRCHMKMSRISSDTTQLGGGGGFFFFFFFCLAICGNVCPGLPAEESQCMA